MDLFRGKYRLPVYVGALTLLLCLLLLALRSIAGTGAFLTGEGDWQTLAGDYRIGTIDYTVDINGQLLLGMDASNTVKTYRMAVPLTAGVRMFDPTVDADNRTREFSEGVTLMRVRVTNRSDSMVDVSAAFSLLAHDAPADGPIRFLPLPVELDQAAAKTLNYRQYVLDTLKLDPPVGTEPQETAALAALAEQYRLHQAANPTAELAVGILPGASSTPGDNTVADGGRFYAYKDVFLLLWTEYGGGEYNIAGEDAVTRQAEFQCVFTVGQLD